jgi:uncharacterized membrane protein YvbJ
MLNCIVLMVLCVALAILFLVLLAVLVKKPPSPRTMTELFEQAVESMDTW